MLTRFKATNFRSIIDLDLDLRYSSSTEVNETQDELYWTHLGGDNHPVRALPCLALFGANASGKSNIVHAFAYVQRLLRKGDFSESQDDFDASIFINRFIPSENISSFMLEFIVDTKRIQYELSLNIRETIVISERFVVDEECYYHVQGEECYFNPLLYREGYDQVKLRAIYDVECSSLYDGVRRQRRLFLQIMASNYGGLNDLLTQTGSARFFL